MKEKLFLCFLLTSFFCFSQGGRINGKLILKDVENYKKVSENTFIILKTSKRIDSVKVDKDLNFVFENLEAGPVRIYLNPRTYPLNRFYKHSLKENEIINLEIPYCSVCPYNKENDNICPVCHKNDNVIPIKYGLIAKITYEDKNGNETDKNGKIISKEEKEKITYKQGGCVISDCHPNWFCQLDQIDF